MRLHSLQFSTRLGAALLGAVGIVAAAAAHADAASDFAAPIKTSLLGSRQQCSDDNKAGQAMLRFPIGTTFVQTDSGLILLNQPAAAKSWEPEWPNTGN
ncbi:MAG TPA: hypothetical protein VGN99_03795 [Steroidobacteraceae bacterium]|nr:hypothetical protein [Steroidobacteraceae bacterium]